MVFIAAALIVFFIARFIGSRFVLPAATIDRIGITIAIIVAMFTGGRAILDSRRAAAEQAAAIAAAQSASPPATVAAAVASASSPAPPAKPGDPIGVIDVLSANAQSAGAAPNGSFTAGSTMYAYGWAGSAAKTRLASLVFVIDGHRTVDGTAHYGRPRPDVAQALAAPAMATSGFTAVPIRLVHLTPGIHRLQVGGSVKPNAPPRVVPAGATFTIQ